VEVPRPRSCLLSEFLAGDISKKESWKGSLLLAMEL
jgi:hypothetical protein